MLTTQRNLPVLTRGTNTLQRREVRLSGSRILPQTRRHKDFYDRVVWKVSHGLDAKQRLALLIPAYNEEAVIEHTIKSAISAGLAPQHIYVVDDSSNDKTSEIASELVGEMNVLKVERSGKGLAVHKAAEQLRLTKRYDWLHIADADGEFDEQYFTALTDNLDNDNVAATGYITSMPGSFIGQYRVYEYAIGMEVIRRFQALAKVITIIPGPTSVFRGDVFDQLDFNANALCEDFDVTLQIHRKKLGSIQFVPQAVARTQDPGSFRDFVKQITRWNRGVVQMFYKHKIGLRANKVDAYLMYQLMQNLLFFMMYCVWVPYLAFLTQNAGILAVAFLSDILITAGFVYFAAKKSRRYDILSAFPLIYALRWVSILVFMKALVEVGLMKKFRLANGVWETVERRNSSVTAV